MATEAKKRANKKYKEKVQRFGVEFTPYETDLWEHLQSQDKKQTYVKRLIREDIERKRNEQN